MMKLNRLALAMLPVLAAAPAWAQDQGRVTVLGEGRVAVVPDVVWIDVGVVNDSETAQEAIAGLSEASDRLISTLMDQGIPSERIQTGQLSLVPTYTEGDGYPGRGELDGFRAETSLVIRSEDTGNLGAILSAAVGEGANTFGGLRFGLSDREAAEDAALSEALTDAMGKASIIAETAGVALGDLIDVTESGSRYGDPQPMMRSEISGDASAIPVAAGEIEITARIEATFALN